MKVEKNFAEEKLEKKKTLTLYFLKVEEMMGKILGGRVLGRQRRGEKTFERLGRNNAYQKSTKKQMHADFLKRELLRRPGTISETGQKIVLERKNNSNIFVVFFFHVTYKQLWLYL